MNNQNTPELLENKIRKIISDQKNEFTEDEILALKAMIKIFNMLRVLRLFGQFIFYVIVSLGILFTQWDNVVSFIKNYFKGL